MKRFLVVDDMEERHDEFDRLLAGNQVVHVWNVMQAVLQVREDFMDEKKFDVIFLDHDIEWGDDRRDVVEFVRWLVETPWILEQLKKDGTSFFIHSWNPEGAENMRSTLVDAGFEVKVEPFKV